MFFYENSCFWLWLLISVKFLKRCIQSCITWSSQRQLCIDCMSHAIHLLRGTLILEAPDNRQTNRWYLEKYSSVVTHICKRPWILKWFYCVNSLVDWLTMFNSICVAQQSTEIFTLQWSATCAVAGKLFMDLSRLRSSSLNSCIWSPLASISMNSLVSIQQKLNALLPTHSLTHPPTLPTHSLMHTPPTHSLFCCCCFSTSSILYALAVWIQNSCQPKLSYFTVSGYKTTVLCIIK